MNLKLQVYNYVIFLWEIYVISSIVHRMLHHTYGKQADNWMQIHCMLVAVAGYSSSSLVQKYWVFILKLSGLSWRLCYPYHTGADPGL